MKIVGNYMVFEDLILDCNSVISIKHADGFNNGQQVKVTNIEVGKGGRQNQWTIYSPKYDEVKEKFLAWAKKR